MAEHCGVLKDLTCVFGELKPQLFRETWSDTIQERCELICKRHRLRRHGAVGGADVDIDGELVAEVREENALVAAVDHFLERVELRTACAQAVQLREVCLNAKPFAQARLAPAHS